MPSLFTHFIALDELIQLIYQGDSQFVVVSKVTKDAWTVHVGLARDGRWWQGRWTEDNVLAIAVCYADPLFCVKCHINARILDILLPAGKEDCSLDARSVCGTPCYDAHLWQTFNSGLGPAYFRFEGHKGTVNTEMTYLLNIL